jgi:ornithine cyclodeaminase/alanine dehydrogenase-like protein (mu-crystallin family)
MSNDSSFPFIPAHAVEHAFPLEIAMQTQRKVFAAFDRGDAVMGNRGVIPNGSDASFAYIARASQNGPIIVKFGSVTNSNSARHLPVVHAYICILDPVTGALRSFIDGESVTRIRTTAASMVAAQTLAAQTKTIAVVGAGLQGIAHVRAALALFLPHSLILVARSISSEAKKLESEFPQLRISQNINDAINEADLIFLCTNTVEPVIKQTLKKGTTLISIGSFSPNREEVAGDIVVKSDLIFGDDSQTIQSQSGSVIAGLKLNPGIGDKIISLGSLLTNSALGRTSPDQVIIYFSVGLGIQDAAIVEKFIELEKQ